MAQAALKREGRFTYADYLTWSDEERWELIDGAAFAMTPAPNRVHQGILVALVLQFGNFFKGKKPCRVYPAPFDVRLPTPGETEASTSTVVQPDLVVVCDPAKLDDRGCKGAPDLAVEILSPHTAAMDLKRKLGLYERAGVREYWIVQPVEKAVTVYLLAADGTYGRPAIYTGEDRIRVTVLPEFEVELAAVFEEAAAGD